jgi:methyl-accepting chemotaxis protein
MTSISSPSNLRRLSFALLILSAVRAFVQDPPLLAYALDGFLFLGIAAILYGLGALDALLDKISTFAEKFSEGDFEARITNLPEQGKLAALCLRVNRVADLTDAFVREVRHSMEHVSEGRYFRKVLERGLPASFKVSSQVLNKVTRATEERVGRFQVHTNAFEKSVDGVIRKLSSEAQDLHHAASSMTETANLTSQRSAGSAQAANQATQNVQNVASAAEELAASIAEISRQVDNSSSQTAAASLQAKETDKLVKSLSEAAQKVGDVVKLINDIAAQTNLLALNATIEAARAGEAGKGFAVVANEVKALASQTTKATEEIVLQINTMQTETAKAVAAVQDIASKINQVNEISGSIASAVNEQKIATQEIAKNIQQAATSTDQVTDDIREVSNAATKTNETSMMVSNVAQGFAEESSFLQKEVVNFLNVVREK